MAQVFEGGKVVGTILTMNGDQQVVPIPGTDSDKLKKSFADYKAFNARSHGGSSSPATPTTASLPAQPGSPRGTSPSAPSTSSETPASAIHFDDATHTITVPRPDGVTVTFVGEDVKIAGFRRLNYILRHQKGSAGRFFERTLGHPDAAGGSLSGGGVEFLKGRRRDHLRFGHGHQQRYASEQSGPDSQTTLPNRRRCGGGCP